MYFTGVHLSPNEYEIKKYPTVGIKILVSVKVPYKGLKIYISLNA